MIEPAADPSRAPRPAHFEPVRIAVDAERSVSALLQVPPEARSCFVFAHGAGAGMTHPFIAAVADGLTDRGIATLRYQFPYLERGSKRVDPPAVAHATVRAAVAEAARRLPGLALVAGGKSFGGRMTSQAQALEPLPGVSGIAFLGFPLHPAGKPGDERAAHLAQVTLPMLFLQGTRDELADVELTRRVIVALGSRATVAWFDDADHSFHVPAKSGRTDADVRAALLDTLAGWIGDVTG
ncbi:alpha/beta family hydrolase [Piscinibacter koreensis]|uniref:Dienelactone hydrolase family protein n=1 Tax=Piscinibacter koreensis TaxID=2742824 RepID=A0A7Y6NNX3_9BURK|nr:alpha/beta family hydrolase [Schlegelella koreensis]NUZ06547.1 dienelactone hydrolase family protein [Schlegelella koreensis]